MTATPLPHLAGAYGSADGLTLRLPDWLEAAGRWADGPNAFLAADLVGQRFLYVGGNLKGLLGVEPEQLQTEGMRYYTGLNHPDDEIVLGQIWADLLDLARQLRPEQRQALQWTIVRRFRHADSTYRWMMVQMKPLLWDAPSGALLANLGVLSDVTPLHTSGPPQGWARYPDGPNRWVQLDLPRRHHTDVNLTLREREVLRLVAQGLTSAEIAVRLFISKETVDTHRKRILAKTHVKNTAELIRLAARLGIV